MAATDKLAGYRNDPKASPQPVEDAIGAPAAVPHEGEDAARKAALAPPAAVPLVTGDRTPAFVDRQRQALAERFKAERAAERKTLVPASHVPFIDGDNPAIPGALPVEDDTQPDDPDTAAHEKERREAEEAALAAATTEPKEPDKPKTYSLKVDGNQFTVSREELLRYAEIDAADAEQFSEPSLVRLAQKQIAASNRLAEANALKDQARRTQQPEPAPRPAPTPSPARTPDPALVNAIEKIQLGDPEEAARALQAVFDAGVNHALRENDQVHAFGGVQAEYAAGIDAFTTQHPDVIANPVLSSAHIALVETGDEVVGLPDHDHVARGLAPSPALGPEVEDVVEIDVGKQRRNHRALTRPLLLNRHDPVFEDTGSQPFLDEPEDARVADPVLKEADNPLLGNLREERPDISVEYEVHLLAADPDDERIQRIVLTAFWSEPIREPEEVFLVDRAQHRSHGSLDDFVFEGRNRERTLAAVFLRNVAPAGRQRPVRSAFDLRMQVLDPAIKVPFVGLPCHAIHTRRSVTLQRVKRLLSMAGSTWCRSDVNCSFFLCLAACRTRSSACDTLSRSCARRVLCWPTFPLVPALRSTNSAADCSALFVDFIATTAESDFSGSCITGYGSSPFRCGHAVSTHKPNPRPPGSRTKSFHICQGL